MSVLNSQSAFRADLDIDTDDNFQPITDQADLVSSLARSISEAAFRRDTVLLRIHRAEFRSSAMYLMSLIREVAPLEGEGGTHAH
jgi:hypothetical protein